MFFRLKTENRKKTVRFHVFPALLLLCLLFCPACGEKTQNEPPQVRTQLLLDILSSLDRKDYNTAIKQISRLRALDKTSVILAELEHIERSNAIIRDAKALMMQGQYDKAEKHISDAIVRYGAQPDLTEARQKVELLADINRCVETLSGTPDSSAMKEAAERLLALTSPKTGTAAASKNTSRARNDAASSKNAVSNPDDMILLQTYAAEKAGEARSLAVFEKDRARFDLYAEYMEAVQSGKEEAPVMEALLEMEIPGLAGGKAGRHGTK